MRCCLLILAGCGRIGFDAPGDALVADTHVCTAWSTPAASLSSSNDDYGPALSADGLEVVFHSDRPGGPGMFDLFHATRPDRASAFGSPELLNALNSPQTEENATLSTDGLTVYFTSNRTGVDAVYRATRPNLTAAFTAPETVDTFGTIIGPYLSADGTELFGSRMNATHDLYVVTDFESAASVSQKLDISTETVDEFYPTVSGDGLTMYFEIGGKHIHSAHRPAIGEPFVYDGLVDTFSSAANDTDPDISHDGQTFMVSSQRGGTDYDLYISQRDCQ